MSEPAAAPPGNWASNALNYLKSMNPSLQGALALGLTGAGASGVMSAMSPDRVGETRNERTGRILRNAAMGGALGAGAGAAIHPAMEYLGKPIMADGAGKFRRDEDFGRWAQSAGFWTGGGAGAGLGFRAALKNNNKLDAMLARIASPKRRAELALQNAGKFMSKGRSAVKGGLMGSLIGTLLPYILAEGYADPVLGVAKDKALAQ